MTWTAQDCSWPSWAPQTWPEVCGYDYFDVYTSSLFLGQDARGNCLPVRQLPKICTVSKGMMCKENVLEADGTTSTPAD